MMNDFEYHMPWYKAPCGRTKDRSFLLGPVRMSLLQRLQNKCFRPRTRPRLRYRPRFMLHVVGQ
jgi:hypothetical protein